jgi:hypothetical protein
MVQIIGLFFPDLILLVCYKPRRTCNHDQVMFLHGPLFKLGKIKKYNEELHNLFSLLTEDDMDGYVAWMGAYCRF